MIPYRDVFYLVHLILICLCLVVHFADFLESLKRIRQGHGGLTPQRRDSGLIDCSSAQFRLTDVVLRLSHTIYSPFHEHTQAHTLRPCFSMSSIQYMRTKKDDLIAEMKTNEHLRQSIQRE